MFRSYFFFAAILPLLNSNAFAENWGHWRGPIGNGTSIQAKPPTEWSSTKNVKWRVPVAGLGSSSPVVWDQQVFITSAIPAEGKGSARSLQKLDFKLLCLQRSDGKLLWQKSATVATPHQETHSTNGFASASPCTDGQHVYAHFGSRGLFCYTMDGQLRWKREDFGEMNTRSDFGEGSSPTLEGDMILVPWDHEGPSSLYAINKLAQKGLVFVGSGHQGSFLAAFRLDGKGDIKDTRSVAWVIDRDTPDIASPLLSSGRLYFHKGKSGQLSCVDAATGKPYYMASRIPGLDSIYASPIAAGGHVYLTARSGTTVVIKDADTLNVVATNSLGEPVDATPAAVDNELFIRGEKHLFCIRAP